MCILPFEFGYRLMQIPRSSMIAKSFSIGIIEVVIAKVVEGSILSL